MNTDNHPHLRLLAVVLALMAVISFTSLVARSDASAAHKATFNPCLLIDVTDTSANANADINAIFGVGVGDDCKAVPTDDPTGTPDLQYAATIDYVPPEWGVPKSSDIPIGAYVGKLVSFSMLGLIGDACNNNVYPEFKMMNATIDMSKTVPYWDPQRENDPQDLEDKQGNEPDDQFDIPSLVGKSGDLPLGVTRYPDYLKRIFKDRNGNTLQPLLRSYGQTTVAKAEVSLQYLIFEPGTVFVTSAGEVRASDPRLGYPMVSVLQYFGDPDAEPDIGETNKITDFCTPLEADVYIYGKSKDNPDTSANEGGKTVRTNPPNGTYNLVNWTVSEYDADDDGIGNTMDPCPYNANPTWDPRISPGNPITPNPEYKDDPDLDGLPTECDPHPNEPSQVSGGLRDEDNDQYGNRGDNCPLIANSAGQNGGRADPPAAADDNQDDADLDGIGDACDQHPHSPEGWRGEVCLVTPVTIGSGGPAPSPAPQNMQPCDPNAELIESTYPGKPCSDGLDNDADGLTDGADPDCTSGGPTPTPTPKPRPPVTGHIDPHETVTTDKEGDGATADTPVEVWLTAGPNGGQYSIEQTDISNTPPQGFQFLGVQVEISAPDATPDDPLILAFQLDSSLIPAGADENTIQVFKDSVQVAACSDASGAASPDPCVSKRELLSDGDAKITVLTSTASSWNLGASTSAVSPEQDNPGYDGSGGDYGPDGSANTGVGSLAPIASSIPAWATIVSALGGAGLLGSLGTLAARIFGFRRPGRRE